MKAVIFAGGIGSRLWPLSRKNSPKQFEKIINGKSTLQLTVERIGLIYEDSDIYISTAQKYKDIVSAHLPNIPEDNIITEPTKRDSGPAVALAMNKLKKKFPHEAVLIMWSDHVIKNDKAFVRLIKESSDLIHTEKSNIIFVGQKARFANTNLGWIQCGNESKPSKKESFYEFKGLRYKPTAELAQYYFENTGYCWNLGYFISTPSYISDLFAKYAKDISDILDKIFVNGEIDDQKLKEYYPQMPSINFDNAVLENFDKIGAYVAYRDIGWSDIGAWDAFKEAMQESEDANVMYGKVLDKNSSNTLLYNLNNKQLVVGLDLNDIVVVNTDDVVLVARKSSMSLLKNVVEELDSTENENLA